MLWDVFFAVVSKEIIVCINFVAKIYNVMR